jgi:hypothetical protein
MSSSTSRSIAGSPEVRVTSNRLKGSVSPLPLAFAKASFRVQQVKNASLRKLLGRERSVATSRVEK